MGPIWVLYGKKSLHGAHVGPERAKCPDSAHWVTYTCIHVCSEAALLLDHFHRHLSDSPDF